MEKEKKQEEKKQKQEQKLKREQKPEKISKDFERAKSLVRVLSTDIPGEKNLLYGLTRIKGISYSFANAICQSLGFDKKRKVVSLSEDEIKKIEAFIQNPNIPSFLMSRRRDIETGKDTHPVTTMLNLQHEFDIRRLKSIRSYRGWRHALGLPVRGQRTRSHFRTGKSLGVQKSKAMPSPSPSKKQ